MTHGTLRMVTPQTERRAGGVGSYKGRVVTVELPPADERRRGGRREDALVRDDHLLQAVASRQLQDDLIASTG